MEITGIIENGKLILPLEMLKDLGLEEGQTLTLQHQEIEGESPSEDDKVNAMKLIGLLDKYRTEDTPTVSLKEMKKGIAEGANRGRF